MTGNGRPYLKRGKTEACADTIRSKSAASTRRLERGAILLTAAVTRQASRATTGRGWICAGCGRYIPVRVEREETKPEARELPHAAEPLSQRNVTHSSHLSHLSFSLLQVRPDMDLVVGECNGRPGCSEAWTPISSFGSDATTTRGPKSVHKCMRQNSRRPGIRRADLSYLGSSKMRCAMDPIPKRDCSRGDGSANRRLLQRLGP